MIMNKYLTYIVCFVTINLYLYVMFRSYKYRLYPSKEQTILIHKHLGCVRWLYNYALDKKVKAYQKDKTHISRFDLQAELPILKKQEETKWLSEVNAQSLQASLRNLDMAFTDFFKEKKGFPKFKSKHNNRQSFQAPQRVEINWENSTIKIPIIKSTPIVLSRKFEGEIKTVTISKTPTNKYFASILVDTNIKIPKKTKPKEKTTIGIDTGIKTFLTCSDKQIFENNRYLKNSLDRLKILQRRASKKQKGSSNRGKANFKVALLHEKITNQRLDYIHKITHKLTNDNQVRTICIEDLNISGMLKNHHLAQSITDVSISKFYEILGYKCEWYGVNLIKIGKFDASSKTCNNCGYINNNLKLSDRVFNCPECNTSIDRDYNASLNIKDWGLHPKNKTGAGCSVEPVELLALVRTMKQENTNINLLLNSNY